MAMKLLLVRHGQTPANVAGRLDTAAPGPGLTALGLDQAAAIPTALAGSPVDALFVSTLIRTRLTATPLSVNRGLEMVQLPGIHEIGAATLENLSDRESIRTYMQTAFSWGLGDLDVVMPGGHDGHEFFARFDDSIATVASATEGTAVVVSHGAAMRVWAAGRAKNIPASYAGEHDIHNTGVLEFEGSPEDGWTLISWQGHAIGGGQLDDLTADDPTGETLSEAMDD